jgi:glycosyltransferase involved in cell wall biosynthesis
MGIATSQSRVERDGMQLWRVPLAAGRAHEGPIQQFWHTFRDTRIESSFRALLADIRPDVVHFQHVQGVSAALIEAAAGWPRVVTLHDYWFFCATSQLVRPDGSPCAGPQWGWNCVDCLTVRPDLQWLRRLRPLVAVSLAYRNVYLRRLLRPVPILLAPSDFLTQQYIRQGFPASRIQRTDLGLDLERLDAAADPHLPTPSGRPHFGYLGALAPHKGVHVLVQAFNELPLQAGLTIYGSEAVFPDYAAKLGTLARHPHIRFAGALDYRHVGAALRQLDCLVVPSLWYENSPLVIQEAYGAGVPVVASRLGALVEKVRDGETGWLFKPGDAGDLAQVLRGLMDHPEQLAAARTRIRPGPTMEQHAGQLLDLYRTL